MQLETYFYTALQNNMKLNIITIIQKQELQRRNVDEIL